MGGGGDAFDLLAINGKDIRPEPIEDRKRRLAGLLRLLHDGIALNEHFGGDGAGHLQACMRLGLRGNSFEAAWLSVPRWPVSTLAQDKEPGRSGGAAAGRRGLEWLIGRRGRTS